MFRSRVENSLRRTKPKLAKLRKLSEEEDKLEDFLNEKTGAEIRKEEQVKILAFYERMSTILQNYEK